MTVEKAYWCSCFTKSVLGRDILNKNLLYSKLTKLARKSRAQKKRVIHIIPSASSPSYYSIHLSFLQVWTRPLCSSPTCFVSSVRLIWLWMITWFGPCPVAAPLNPTEWETDATTAAAIIACTISSVCCFKFVTSCWVCVPRQKSKKGRSSRVGWSGKNEKDSRLVTCGI